MLLLSIIPSLHFGLVWFCQSVERATSPILERLALWKDSPGYIAYAWWFWLAGWRPSEHKPCLFWCQGCQGMVGGAAQLEGSILRASLMGTNEIHTDREQMGLGRVSRKTLPPQLLVLHLHYSLGRLSRMEWLTSHSQCTPRHGPQQSPTSVTTTSMLTVQQCPRHAMLCTHSAVSGLYPGPSVAPEPVATVSQSKSVMQQLRHAAILGSREAQLP